jgi:nucleoside-diphosphate-sugar epimerase
MSKISLIGYGWLGLPLAQSLQAAGHEVAGSTTSESKLEMLNKLGLPAVLLDLANELPAALPAIFENTDIVILNFPPKYKGDFTQYADQCLKAAGLFADTAKFILISSTTVYPNEVSVAREAEYDRFQFTETDPIAFAEEQLHQLLGKRLTIVRMAGLIGGERHIANFFAGKTDIPHGDTPVNLIHRKDCIRIIERILEKECWGETFNACASEHPAKGIYYTFACEQLGLEKPHFLSGILGKTIDNSHSKKTLDFTYLYDTPFDFFKEL